MISWQKGLQEKVNQRSIGVGVRDLSRALSAKPRVGSCFVKCAVATL